MDSKYEADILRVFAHFVSKSLVERKLRTVPWCTHCETTLAKAEIDYTKKQDSSCYVLFELTQPSRDLLVEGVGRRQQVEGSLMESVYFVAWTTTPWTIPLNEAVCLHPRAYYVGVQHHSWGNNKVLVVAEEYLEDLRRPLGFEEKVVFRFFSGDLCEYQLRVHHPLEYERTVPVLFDTFVVLDRLKVQRNTENKTSKATRFRGDLVPTGVVHLAPSCGVDDYKVGLAHKLKVVSAVTSDGRYTSNEDLYPPELRGKKVQEGHKMVLWKLFTNKKLLFLEPVVHEYPHCWRCKNPLLWRSTPQWFCVLDAQTLERTLDLSKTLNFYPPTGRHTYESYLKNRDEWCVSRQRKWGVPLVALHCKVCLKGSTTEEMVKYVANGVEREGLGYWERVPMEALKPQCVCGNANPDLFRKETDVLDVWFDSGVSNYSVLFSELSQHNPPTKFFQFPCDVYLEGKDQYRGWFQSSSLCSMVSTGSLPTKNILCHGFLVDEKGRKFSKSSGVGLTPKELVKKYNADVLRLWSCSFDYTKDLCVSQKTLEASAQNYRKFRASMRYLLSNLYDFEWKDSKDLSTLHPLDKCFLATANDLYVTVKTAMDHFDFSSAVAALVNYFRTTLSGIYFGTSKMRLYFLKQNDPLRKETQKAYYHLLEMLNLLLAPFLSFLAEEVHLHYPCKGPQHALSVHLRDFSELERYTWEDVETTLPNAQKRFEKLLFLRTEVNKIMEKEKLLSCWEYGLTLMVNGDSEGGREVKEAVEMLLGGEFMGSDFFLVSSFEMVQVEMEEDFKVDIKLLNNGQCHRCRRYTLQNKQNTANLCNNCSQILNNNQ
eukprot:TRINITY_DN282_c0_g1_i1.p1 TRINITY_DN282_c0_g1~~TRINITY_DN282_c0_g1_i1.p1  ORF type:complete len:825 (-),score=189.35 TRINITY_DN282_c0_g1_i1:21-2495(-)